MPRYVFSDPSDKAGREQAIKFCNANGIIPKNVVARSEFQVIGTIRGLGNGVPNGDYLTDVDGKPLNPPRALVVEQIVTREFEIGGWDGKSRVWHEGCCDTTHFAKREGRYDLKVRPEEFGFVALDQPEVES